MSRKRDVQKFYQPDLFQTQSYDTPYGKMHIDFLAHPFFTLQINKPDMSTVEYQSNDGKIDMKLQPSGKGRATINDCDFVIFMQAKLVQMKKEGDLDSPNPVLEIDTAEFLEFSDRSDGAKSYEGIESMLDRLGGSKMRFSAYDAREDISDISNYTFIDPEWSAVSRGRTGSLLSFRVKCRDWFVRPIMESDRYLTIYDEYWDEKRPLIKRINQVLRKHAHRNPWKVGWETFHKLVGTPQSLTVFRSRFRKELKDGGGVMVFMDTYSMTEVDDRKFLQVNKNRQIEGDK
jgi:hypothetical protein